MLLLDIIAIPRRVLDTVRSVPKPIVRDTVTVPSDTTDTVASTLSVHGGYRQQLADAAPIPSGNMGMTGDDLLWTILAVVVALGNQRQINQLFNRLVRLAVFRQGIFLLVFQFANFLGY